MTPDHIWNLIAKKLTKEASDAELAELELALRLNPELHYSLQAITDFWESHPAIKQKFAERAFDAHVKRMESLGIDFTQTIPVVEMGGQPKPSIFTRTQKKFLGASIAFIGLSLGLFFLNRREKGKISISQEKSVSEVSTRYGSKTNMLLPDGTSVMLNAGSRLSYDSAYGKKNREVTLSGEGFFDVVKNAEKPFVIHTGKINIRVLGTAFNVRSYPGEKTIETSLIRGSIEVTFNNRPKQKVILKPNQKLVVESEDSNPDPSANKSNASVPAPGAPVTINHLSHFGPDSLVTETAWVQNKLVFQDKSFPEVADMMQRWYNVHISLDDASLDTLHLTGSFEKENIQQALNALMLLSKFNYNIQNNEVHILKTQKS